MASWLYSIESLGLRVQLTGDPTLFCSKCWPFWQDNPALSVFFQQGRRILVQGSWQQPTHMVCSLLQGKEQILAPELIDLAPDA